MVASGQFATSLEGELATSTSYTSSTLTMGSIRSVQVKFTGDNVAGNSDTQEVLDAVASTVPFSSSALDITVASESGNSVAYTVVFAGDSDSLETVETTLATPDFTIAFATAMSSSTQGNGATIQWGSINGGETSWSYSFALVGVSTMNNTQFANVLAASLTTSSTPITADMISLDTSSVGDTTYSVTATFSGELYEITAIQLQMLNGWKIQFQSELTGSDVFNGAVYTDVGTTSSTTWSFQLENFGGTVDDITSSVATAFGVASSTLTVSYVGSTVSVKFEDTTGSIQVVELAVASGSYQSTLESEITAVDSAATITYIN